MNLLSSSQTTTVLFFAIYVWTLLWQGLSLWRSAKLEQKNWFVANLVLNGMTIGILGIVYLFFFAKKKMTLSELKFWENK